MTDKQWEQLVGVIEGKTSPKPAVAFIIDSPWLPNWYGASILDYFTNEEIWFQANKRALETFPEAIFLPGFWSEFGMCTEPSAFGSKCVFFPNEFPFAEKLIADPAQVDGVAEPNPKTDGLLPFMLNRLKSTRQRIEDLGHRIRFSVSRGPLNIASFLMGTTEFLTALKTDHEQAHKLLRLVTTFLKKWHRLQRETFDSIQGMLVLDDIVGFLGEKDFLAFGYPYLKEVYAADLPVKFFHNDAECATSIKYYPELGINFYNPGVFNSIGELSALCGNRLTFLGNIPPRDVLAKGSPGDVRAAVAALMAQTPSTCRVVLSCAGGMPPAVNTENLKAFIEAAGSSH